MTAACLSHLGHRVSGVDRDTHKVESVRRGEAPFYEPGLPELLAQGRAAGRLDASTSVADVLDDADVVIVCVGTPSAHNGNLNLEQLRRVCLEMGPLLANRRKPLVVAIRSTVFPGTCEDVVAPALGEHPQVSIVSNPEFLREGAAVKDFLEPSLLVVGGPAEAARRVAALYGALPVEPCFTALRTAEMIKYACNAFHALKIAFANEVGTLSAQMGVPAGEVMQTLCQDRKLNISPAYLKPGFAFGGSCLPKDLRALVFRASRMDLSLPLLESVLPSNQRHLERAIEAALALPGRKIGVLGLAFKEQTDDLRESPVVSVVEQLLAKGREVKVYDPHIQLGRLHGSNLNFLLTALPHVGRLMTDSVEEVLDWAEEIVVAQPPSADLRERLRGRTVLDVTEMGKKE